MYVAILGRQPAISMAELERLYGPDKTQWFSDKAALVEAKNLDISQLGGSLKIGRVVLDLPTQDWPTLSKKITQHYSGQWSKFDGKITLGLSVYGFKVSSRDVQKIGITLKQKLKQSGISLRLVPNDEPALNTATSHHNKLGLAPNKVELLIVRDKNRIVVAESTGAQNITALAKRDQQRPKRDAFVGMLPPKLALVMVNLAVGKRDDDTPIVLLDPFCGTGVILQEAALLHLKPYGTDLSEKMIRYSRDNLNWLQDAYHIRVGWYLHEGDAMTTTWRPPIDAVASEVYLGQPFSAPPSPAKLTEVRGNCNHIISSFLKNIAPQLLPNTPLCLAVPAWRDQQGKFTHLPLINQLEELGFTRQTFTHIKNNDLLYFREDQVVARELLVLTKIAA